MTRRRFRIAINALPAPAAGGTGGEIYIPAGVYLLSGPLNVTNKPITFRGDGQRVSVLKWTAATNGIVFDSQGIVNAALNIHSLSLLTTTAGTTYNSAVFATFASTAGGFHGSKGFISLNVSDLHIGPEDNAQDYWRYGLYLVNVTSAKISRFNIIGNAWNVTDGYGMAFGILIKGRSLGVRITDGDVYSSYYGIKTIDDNIGIEGVGISGVDTTDVNYGIFIESPDRRSGTWISNCHTASRIRGIYLYAQAQAFVETR